MDLLCKLPGRKKCSPIVVFDAYRVKGHATEILDYHNIHGIHKRRKQPTSRHWRSLQYEMPAVMMFPVATLRWLEQTSSAARAAAWYLQGNYGKTRNG